MTSLSAEDVRRALNAWSAAGLFRISGLGDRITIDEILPRGCHTVRVTSQYETREVVQVQEPYNGGRVDNIGQPPERWDIPVSQPGRFEDRSVQVPVPHTDRVANCPGCVGAGKAVCQHCKGAGQKNCDWCHGKGTQFGGKEPCRHCHGMGRDTCNWCHGSGRVTCGDCHGRGQVKFYSQLKVVFRVDRAEKAVGNMGLPEQLVLGARGEELMNWQSDRIDHPPSINPDADACLERLLRTSHREESADTRLLQQRAEVERVPVFEVTYSYLGGQKRRLWVYGPDHRVHAPDAPWRWGLLTAVIIGSVLLGAGLAVLVYWLAFQ
jgi:hypothetical protein